jgi:hypothetical protein
MAQEQEQDQEQEQEQDQEQDQGQVYLAEETAKKLLAHYLFEDGPYRVDIIPKRVDPAFADKYIRDNVAPEAEPAVCRHARQFIDFYELRQTLPHFRDFLKKAESDGPAFSRSLQIVMLLGEVGAEDAWKLADDYFQNQLLTVPLARQWLPGLLRCWAALGPKSSLSKLEELFTIEVDFRQKTRDRGDEGELNYQRLRAVYANDLPRAKRAVEYRGKVEQMKDDARLKALIDNYARLDSYPPEYLNDWSARMLRRAAAESDETRDKIIKLMRERIEVTRKAKTADQETKAFAKRRLLRAIEFFDKSQLEDEDLSFLKAQLKVSAEGDLLSTIQPQPVREPD